MTPAAAQLPIEGEMPSLGGATGWLNSQPLTPAGLRGKVVLIDVWTYTCINWLRSLPYVRAWATKYKDQGLVVIGVHSPEFAFEKNLDNVRRAAKEMKVNHPIAVDSELCDMACSQEPILAGALFRRCAGANSTSSVRRGRIRTVGKDHSTIARRGRKRRQRSRTGFGRCAVAWKLPPIGAV